MVLMCLQMTASPEEELLQIYVRARAITCPIFQCFVCLCEIMSANCQSSCISKHSYMHNHASYVLIHLIKLLCYSYTFASSIPMLISVNFKILQSCQFHALAVTSSQFPFVSTVQFVFVNGQVASSHPRTACACQFTLVIGRAASSYPRTACTCQFAFILVISQAASSHPGTACTCQFVFILVVGQAASSNTRTACTYPLFLPSAKWLAQIQEQLVPFYLSVFPVKFPVQAKRTTCTCQFAIWSPQ